MSINHWYLSPLCINIFINWTVLGTLIIIGVVIFGLQTNYNLGYSFWLTTIAGGVALVTAVLLVGDICMKQPETTTRQFQVVYYPTAGTQVVQYPVIYSPINGQTVQYPARGVVLSGQYSSGYSQTLVPMCQNQAAFLQTPTLSHSANNLAAEPPPYSSLSIQNHTTEKKHSWYMQLDKKIWALPGNRVANVAVNDWRSYFPIYKYMQI